MLLDFENTMMSVLLMVMTILSIITLVHTDITSGIDRVQGQTFVAGDNMVGTGNANDTITLYDASGRMVGMGQGNADVSQLQPGVYMATVKTATGSRTVKFVKK